MAVKTHKTERQSYYHMKYRCLNVKDEHYKNYGERGITISPEWLNSFDTFYRDMGPRPIGTSLERKDNNGPYSKENCVWADKTTQNNNLRVRKDAIYLTLSGRTQQLSVWARELDVKYETIYMRFKRGWTVEAILKGKNES